MQIHQPLHLKRTPRRRDLPELVPVSELRAIIDGFLHEAYRQLERNPWRKCHCIFSCKLLHPATAAAAELERSLSALPCQEGIVAKFNYSISSRLTYVDAWLQVVAELIATFLLVFVTCGAGALSKSNPKLVSQLGQSLAGGLIVTVMIYAVGHISGAHMNPAVTLAFAVNRHFPWIQVTLRMHSPFSIEYKSYDIN